MMQQLTICNASISIRQTKNNNTNTYPNYYSLLCTVCSAVMQTVKSINEKPSINNPNLSKHQTTSCVSFLREVKGGRYPIRLLEL